MEALDKKTKHVPFRNSKLTFLLQDVLGGNSRCMLIFTAAPGRGTADETETSFKFAMRMRNITLGDKLPPRVLVQDRLFQRLGPNQPPGVFTTRRNLVKMMN